MASLIENLIDVLNTEYSLYEELYQLSLKKTPVIVAGNLEELSAITGEEQARAKKLQELEKKREAVVKDIAMVLNLNTKDVTVKSLVIALNGQKEQKSLSEIRDKLKKILKDFGTVNDMNKHLVQDSLDMAEFNLNLYRSASSMPQTGNYDRSAENIGQVGMPVRTSFDTKR